MNCSKCYFDNPADTRFCGNCGTQIKPSEKTSDSFTATAQTPIREFTRGSTLVKRYEIIEKLGRGGMGQVFRVVDKTINEEMALKLINPAIASNEKTVERFKNELKFARKITHKNVCRMYDLNESEGTLFITMEYVPGEDLKSMIRMMGQLSVGRAISAAKQVCEGLAEAHRLEVVHRDLKPQNIMIDKEGNTRIMDFGVARSLKAEGITGAGMMVGTPEYMSPEQVKGEATDQRSDIYALGVILFEMLSGRLPFEGDTSLSIALKHKTDPPPDPREFNAQIPENLSLVILKCMEKEKEKRYQGAEELLSELNKIEEEISTEERIPPAKKPGAVTPRKRLVSFLLPGILFAAIIAILGYLFLPGILQKEKPGKEIFGEIKWKNSIAILPFKDLSSQKDQQPLCEAMTDAIITKLASIVELKVIPYYSVQRYKDTDKSPKEIGEELDVKTILSLNLQKDGNLILVRGQLSDVKEDFVLDSYEYESEFVGIFKVQDTISKNIASRLKVRLVEERLNSIKKKEPKDSGAYKYYVWGKYFEKKYKDFQERSDFEEAVKNYERAIDVDPDYALAFWSLGNIYQALFVKDEIWKYFDLMEKNYENAYQIDQDLAETNAGLGWVYYYKGELDEAYNYYKRAFELDPNSAEINYHVGGFLKDIGLYPTAIEFYSRAIKLDPLDISYRRLCARCYMYIGEYEEAVHHLKEAFEFGPDNVRLHFFYARVLIMMKKYDEAGREIARVKKLELDNPNVRYYKAWILAVKGEKEKALAIIREVEDPVYLTYLLSNIYAILGMKDEAIENIKESIEKGFHETQGFLHSYLVLINNHFYDSLRDDPRFKEIVKKENKKYRERKKKYGIF